MCNYLFQLYQDWCRDNAKVISHPSYLMEECDDCYISKFRGVASELTCRICNDGRAEVFIHDKDGEYWDIIVDFDVNIRRSDNEQYYCWLCEPATHYLTIGDIWAAHVFVPLNAWLNSLTERTYVCLWGYPECSGGWGASLVDDPDKALLRLNRYHTFFPILKMD